MQKKQKILFLVLAVIVVIIVGVILTPKIIHWIQNPIHTPWVRQYAPAIASEVAQDMHLTPDQVEAQLTAGKTLVDIATAQHLSASQLHTMELQAIKDVGAKAIKAGDT